MEVLDKYQTAKKDISLNKHPHRSEGHIHLTPGQRRIISRSEYRQIRVLNQKITQLKEQKEEMIREMLLYQSPFNERDATHYSNLERITKQLKAIEEKQTIKEAERNGMVDDLKNRGILVDLVAEKQRSKPVIQANKIEWKRILTIVLIYLVIEAFIYITQYDSQRDVRSYEEIGARVLAMFILIGTFHIVAHLNRLQKKLIYSLYLGVCILLIFLMMFAPPVLHFVYPETNTGVVDSEWVLDEDAEAVTTDEDVSYPGFIELYRKMEWAPAGLGIVAFLIIFFVVPNPMLHREDLEGESSAQNKDENEHQEKSWAQQELKALEKSISDLRMEKEKLSGKAQKLKHYSSDLIPIRSKLQDLKQAAVESEDKISDLKIQKEELIHDLETELNEYRVEFENILTNDQVKSSVMRPEWPNRRDIVQHFNLANS